jgi:hypothetical protein
MWWGKAGSWHCGQATILGSFARSWARRMSLLAFDFFLFGTAIFFL